MLKKPASGVLDVLSASTYRSVRLATSLAAALLDSLFEHPSCVCSSCPKRAGHHNMLLWSNCFFSQAAQHFRFIPFAID
jgi:hypothetical protein